MKRKAVSIFLASAMVLGLTGCAAQGTATENNSKKTESQENTAASGKEGTDAAGNETADVIKIGVLVPLTGTQTQAGNEVRALVKLFEDVINNKVDINLPFHDVEGLPNLGGAKVEFVIGDLSTPDVAMAEAERLITEEKCIGFAGNFSSASTKTVMVPAEKYGAIVLSEGTSESLPKAGYKYYGRTWSGDGLFIEDSYKFFDYLNDTQNAGIENVALISEDSEFGTNIAKVEAEKAEEFGYKVVENISYNAAATNMTSEVLRLKKADADAVLMSSYIADGLLLMSTFKEQGYFPKILMGQRGAFTSSDFISNLGADSDYAFTTSRWNLDLENPLITQLNELYKTEYSEGIDIIGDVFTSAWDAYVIAMLANQAGSTDVDAMRAEMEKGLEIDSAQDPSGLPGYKYGSDGQNEKTMSIVVQMKDKAIHTVYPDNVKAMDAIYPAIGWSDR